MNALHFSESATTHDPGLHPGAAPLDAVVRGRRTLRAFRPLPVAREVVNEIQRISACSPKRLQHSTVAGSRALQRGALGTDAIVVRRSDSTEPSSEVQ